MTRAPQLPGLDVVAVSTIGSSAVPMAESEAPAVTTMDRPGSNRISVPAERLGGSGISVEVRPSWMW